MVSAGFCGPSVWITQNSVCALPGIAGDLWHLLRRKIDEGKERKGATNLKRKGERPKGIHTGLPQMMMFI